MKKIKLYWLNNFKWLIFVIIFFTWVLFSFIMPMLILDSEIRGQIGDMFGSINALFTGMALAGVIVSNMIQNETLKVQKTDLELYSKDLKENTDQLSYQSKLLSVQRFETTLFNLIESHRNKVKSITSNSSADEEEGLKLLAEYANEYFRENEFRPIKESDNSPTLQYGEFIQFVPEFEQIYNSMIFILQFIINEEKDEDRRKFYGSLFSIHMTRSEKFMYTLALDSKIERFTNDSQHEAILIKIFNIRQDTP